MTVSPVRAALTGVAVMMAVTGGVAFPAPGQDTDQDTRQNTGQSTLTRPAVVLTPKPKQLKPAARGAQAPDGKAGPAVPRSGYQARPVGRALSGIEVNRLGAVNSAAVGILDGSQGGFGMDLWQGSRLAFVKRLLAEHPERVKSHVMRGLLRRVLLSPATPPEGGEGGEGVGFTTARLRALIAMGEYKAGLELLDAIPRKNREAAFFTLDTELKFLTGKVPKACAVAATEVTRRKETFWQKALIYCQILAGEMGKAEFGLTLLREAETLDTVFLTLAQSMIAGEPTLPEATDEIGLLPLAMLKTAKPDMALGALRRYPAGLLMVAENPVAEDRFNAIEIAAEEGFLAGDALLKQYAAMLPPAGLPTAGSITDKKNTGVTALDRARLFVEAQKATVPTAKAEILNQVIVGARDASRLGGVSRIFAPVVKSLAPENDLLWGAPTAFRMLLLGGETERAGAWFALARQNAVISPDASKLYQALLPLNALAQLGVSAARQPPPLGGLTPDQAILYLSLFHELGGNVPLQSLEGFIYRSERPTPLPDPVLWHRLQRLNAQKIIPIATQTAPATTPAPALTRAPAPSIQGTAVAPGSGPAPRAVDPAVFAQALRPFLRQRDNKAPTRLGERILMMLVMLGERSLDELNPLIAGEVVRSLRHAGLPAEARAFAMEVAINAGL